jgi:hypothetical protein
MDLLRKARRASYVDWGLASPAYDDVSRAVAINTMNLEEVDQWEATYRFQSDPDGAVGDLATGEAMLRSEVDGLGLSGLIPEIGCHFVDMKLLARNVAGISNAASPDLDYVANGATTPQLFEGAFSLEAARMQGYVDGSADPAALSRAETAAGLNFGDSAAPSPRQAIADLEWIERTEQAMGTAMMEPGPQFQQWWSAKEAEAASMPGTGLTVTLLRAVQGYVQVSIAESAMLSAGMALEEGDQARFDSIVDPATGQPFTYTQTATGFQLGSGVRLGEKTVSLSFLAPAK